MEEKTPFKFFKSTEEVVSMFLGLVIVMVAAGLVFNYFQYKKGSVDLPGVTDQKNIELGEAKLTPTAEVKKEVVNEYVVKKGDSLWKIAQANYGSGYKWVEISKANKLKNPGILVSGQKLVMPGVTEVTTTVKTQTSTTQKIESGTYKVVKGDSLWNISVKTYSDGYKWTRIWNENKSKIKNPGKLEIGMTLNIPKL